MACMIFVHIRQESSLRDIDIALNAHASRLYHIGIKQCPRSTLADTNECRDYRIYEEFAKSLMQRSRRIYAQTKLAVDIDSAVYTLNASTVDLTLSNNFPLPAEKIAAIYMARWEIEAFFQVDQVKPQSKKLLRNITERSQNTNMDRDDFVSGNRYHKTKISSLQKHVPIITLFRGQPI